VQRTGASRFAQRQIQHHKAEKGTGKGDSPLSAERLQMNKNKKTKNTTNQMSSDLEGIVWHMEPKAIWKDWVYSKKTLTKLRKICRGFTPGKSITCLFEGEGIQGKSLAAEIIAKELCLDIYHVDLSRVVSKYIGETEKNLNKVFDQAENHNCVLFFDEADALFSRRDEEDDAHDHPDSKGVSFFFKRIEEYEGVSILATTKHAFDAESLRRFRFVVDFPPED
jgi:AAA+ superfamily predicted ATPase